MPQKFLECEQSRDMEKREHSISIGSTFSPHIFSKKKKKQYFFQLIVTQNIDYNVPNSHQKILRIP